MRFHSSLIILIATISSLVSLSAHADPFAWGSSTPTGVDYCAQMKSILHEGDLIFKKGGYVWSEKIAEAGGGWSSHDGLALLDATGEWVVYEAVFPHSRITPLCSFVAPAKSGLAITRLKTALTAEEIAKMHVAADAEVGLHYDLGFDFDQAGTVFCSKMIYDIYAAAVGVGVGQVVTFKELLASNPTIDLTFWKIWFLDQIPWDRRTVTPADQYLDPNFQTVFAVGLPD